MYHLTSHQHRYQASVVTPSRHKISGQLSGNLLSRLNLKLWKSERTRGEKNKKVMGKPPQPIQNGKEEMKEIDTATTSNNNESSKKVTRKLPSPRELVSHYESQGMDSQEASFKVIEDLQGALFRVISSSRNDKNRNNIRNVSSETSRKLDVINARLLSLDMKVDSKPGYPQTLAIGMASGGLLQVLPRVADSVVQIWNTVRNATNSKQ
ncbi:hypothetical protein HAX54_035446 [Datura stramonium]|uniref:Uncharacterized protein n=1 Tax=Datura stramonium TaxID=4076 RepID=A0ABS8SFK9_DATST|nr:hypothetical protein [Datura stramonium]